LECQGACRGGREGGRDVMLTNDRSRSYQRKKLARMRNEAVKPEYLPPSLLPFLPPTSPSSASPNSTHTPCCPNPTPPHTSPCSCPGKHPSLDSARLAPEWSGRNDVCSLRILCLVFRRRRRFSKGGWEGGREGGVVSKHSCARRFDWKDGAGLP
jgi:hypothetical protein